MADTGGPYSEEVGKEILFDGSKSTDDGGIVEYKWTFGDGGRGYGKTSKHRYTKIGFYTVNLTVTDNNGEKDTDNTGVYIYPVELHIDVTVSPSQERYEYGDLLKRVDITVSYLDGSGVENAMVSGILSGKETVDLIFKEEEDGRYHADLYYPILKGEEGFIDIYVNATDSLGNSEEVFKKLILIPKDTELDLLIQEPRDRLFAHGQEAGFEIKFINMEGEKIREGEVILYESWTDRNFSFIKDGDIYSLSYEIPKNAKTSTPLIIHGKGLVGDEEHNIVKTVQLDVTRNLKVDFIEPKPGQYTPGIIEIRVNITYPNGEIIKEEGMNATIGNYSLALKKDEGYFVGNYTLKPGEDVLKIKVNDPAGNEGEAEVQLSTEKISGGYVFDLETLKLLLFLGCCLLLMLVSFRHYYKKKQGKGRLKQEYEELKQETNSIKKLTKRVMHEYYTRKISEGEARKRVLDYEKELMMGREKMKHVAEQLGMKNIETEWKEELIEWIVEKLGEGEDPELLKKGLSDVGLDPNMVDKVKKTLM